MTDLKVHTVLNQSKKSLEKNFSVDLQHYVLVHSAVLYFDKALY